MKNKFSCLAKLHTSELNGKTYYCSLIEADGVSTNFMTCDKPTGTCAVAIKEKERSLVANLSAANEYKANHFSTSESRGLWENAEICYVAGFWLTVTPEAMIMVGNVFFFQKFLMLNFLRKS